MFHVPSYSYSYSVFLASERGFNGLCLWLLFTRWQTSGSWSWKRRSTRRFAIKACLSYCLNNVAFNQEKALEGAFSVITNEPSFPALVAAAHMTGVPLLPTAHHVPCVWRQSGVTTAVLYCTILYCTGLLGTGDTAAVLSPSQCPQQQISLPRSSELKLA